MDTLTDLISTVYYLAPSPAFRWASHKGLYGDIIACNNALNRLAGKGIIDKPARGIYRKKGLEGQGDPHALAVSDALIDVLIDWPDARIFRETPLPINRRPDAVVLLERDGHHQLFFLEVELACGINLINAKIRDYAEGGDKLREWFENFFRMKTETFSYHLRFITDTPIPTMKGVIHEPRKNPPVLKARRPPVHPSGKEEEVP